MTSRFEHIVVGGGISGLGMAHFAARSGVPTLVLESGDRVGGCLHSRRFPETGDFWVEAGSHSCFNSYSNLLGILDDLGLTHSLVAKQKLRYSLYRNGEQKTIFSALHPLELAFSLPKLAFTPKEGRSVAEYYSSVVGRRNYEDLFAAAFSSVICQPAGDFPAELLFRKKPRNKDIVRSFTLPEGLGQLPSEIAGQDNLQLKIGQAAESITREDDQYRLRTTGGGEYSAPRLTLAVPPDVAARLFPDDFAALRGILNGIAMTEIESLALVVLKEALELAPLAGLIAVDEAFYSMVSRDYLEDQRYRGFTFHFKPGGQLDRQAKLKRCAEVLGIDETRIAGHSFTLNRLPMLRKGHQALVDKIDHALQGSSLALTGNYFLGVSIEDCLVRSRGEFERLFGR